MGMELTPRPKKSILADSDTLAKVSVFVAKASQPVLHFAAKLRHLYAANFSATGVGAQNSTEKEDYRVALG
jgi:hypothetical protein